MKGISSWNYTPYALLNAPNSVREFYVCQITPGEKSFGFAFRDGNHEGAAHTLLLRERGQAVWQEIPILGLKGCKDGLDEKTDYEFAIRRDKDGAMTSVRLVRPGKPEGVVVNYLHKDDPIYAFSGRYLCSPSLLPLPSGRILASMDVYAPAQAQNLTLIFESLDGGESWQYVTELYPCFWGKLFLHRGKVYMLAMACEYGDLLIGVSEDEGHTWQPPVRLFNGSNAKEIGPHKAPMPVISHEGWLYTAIDYGSWKYGSHDNCILSIREEDDLLNPANWHLTSPWAFDTFLPGMPVGKMTGCIEGNAVVAPDGSVVNVLRLGQADADPCGGNAVILKMKDPDEPLVFDQVISFPLGANTKFVVFREGNWYVAVGNEYYDASLPKARNVLSACISKDLVHWEVVERIVDERETDSKMVAFQYPDAVVWGNDLLVLSRTAWKGANNFHDANLITFHQVKNFRMHLK